MRHYNGMVEDDYPDEDGEWEETYSPSPDGDDDDETISCQYCGKPMWEESPRCPYCGNYISREDEPYRLKPFWIILTVILLLLAFWIRGGF